MDTITEQLHQLKECRCPHVRHIVREILTRRFLEVRGDDYGLVQIWCRVCNDGFTFRVPEREDDVRWVRFLDYLEDY